MTSSMFLATACCVFLTHHYYSVTATVRDVLLVLPSKGHGGTDASVGSKVLCALALPGG